MRRHRDHDNCECCPGYDEEGEPVKCKPHRDCEDLGPCGGYGYPGKRPKKRPHGHWNPHGHRPRPACPPGMRPACVPDRPYIPPGRPPARPGFQPVPGGSTRPTCPPGQVLSVDCVDGICEYQCRQVPGATGGATTSFSRCVASTKIPKGCGPAGCFCGVERGICTTFKNNGDVDTGTYEHLDCAFGEEAEDELDFGEDDYPPPTFLQPNRPGRDPTDVPAGGYY